MDGVLDKSTIPTSTSSSSQSSEKSGAIDQGDESSEENYSVPKSLIGADNYLTLTEGTLCALTKDELTEASVQCKKLILDSAVCSDERKWLVRRLIELRYQLLTIEDVEDVSVTTGTELAESRIVLGHHFRLRYQLTWTRKRYCDTCCKTVWNAVQSWYQCSDCRYRCHTKCIESIVRPCPHLTAAENTSYEAKICPEAGLAVQNYMCAECKQTINFKNAWCVPRLCDYTGLYYCTSCHWNNSVVVPARVARNWDLKSYYVSRATYQFLYFTQNRPLISPDSRLYGFVKELAEIKILREEFSLMKTYLVQCREAKEEEKLMWYQFGTRSHLLEPSGMFSLRDLMELQSGKLLNEMRDTALSFADHITKSCKICSGKGYICELCEEKDDILFPFNSNVYTCPICSWVYHKPCWFRSSSCQKCERNRRKQLDSSGVAESSTL